MDNSNKIKNKKKENKTNLRKKDKKQKMPSKNYIEQQFQSVKECLINEYEYKYIIKKIHGNSNIKEFTIII